MTEDMILFKLSGELFTFRILEIKEIIEMVPITFIPRVSSNFIGMINLRGDLIPVLNLQLHEVRQIAAQEMMRKILIVKSELGFFGVIPDVLCGIIRDVSVDKQKPSSNPDGFCSSYCVGVGYSEDQVFHLLDPFKIATIFRERKFSNTSNS